ncbi:MAG: hypothetical protein JW834_04280, partial [Candidatus Diapherotrites archaeon]|nr:hypothetical protein [Candidatus Diapherotrites archaeon]
FCSFAGGASNAFRVDFPSELAALPQSEQHDGIRSALSRIAMFSLDPKYKDYPYPLGAVHTDAVMRPIDRDLAKQFVQKQIEAAELPDNARDLIARDIEIDNWYEKFRKRAL